MKMNLTDTFTVDGVRRTADGYLAAFARVARTGVQEYRGSELGRPDLDRVKVYRPESEVFSADALKSFAHRPVTLTHPKTMVNAKNWKKYAKGQTGDEVVRDGQYVRVPMVMMDAGLIDAYERQGIKELSMGYSCDLDWRQGITDSGEKYDAVQTTIRGNHLAVVPTARGGDQLRIGDDGTFRAMVDHLKLDAGDDENEDNESYTGDAWSDESRAAALDARRNASHHYQQAHDHRDKADKFQKSGDKNGAKYHSNAAGYHLKAGQRFDEAAKHYEAGRKEEGDKKSTSAYQSLSKINDAMQESLSSNIEQGTSAERGVNRVAYPRSSGNPDDDYVDCPQCGAEIPPDATDCPECGHRMNNTNDGEVTMKTIMIDSVPVNVADDQGAAIIERHVRNLLTQVADAASKLIVATSDAAKANDALSEAGKAVSTKDGEIAVLKKQLDDSKVTPEKLDLMVKDRLSVISAATPLLDKSYVFDGKTIVDIKRAAVDAYLGDSAKGMSEGAVDGAFVAATMDAKKAGGGSQPIRRALFSGGAQNIGDARQTAYDEKTKRLEGNWKTPVRQ